jgi:hypothetical protein
VEESTRRLKHLTLIVMEAMERVRWLAVYTRLRHPEDNYAAVIVTRNMRERCFALIFTGDHPSYYLAMVISLSLPGNQPDETCVVCLTAIRSSTTDPRQRAYTSYHDLHSQVPYAYYSRRGHDAIAANLDHGPIPEVLHGYEPGPSYRSLVALYLLLVDALMCMILLINCHGLEEIDSRMEGFR